MYRNKFRKFRYKPPIFIDKDDGVSNIVTSIMMLGIFLSILAMVFTVYVPIWTKIGESNHMGDVESSFLDLKSTIDKQIADDDGLGSTLSTSIKLGAEGGAIMGIGRTSGTLEYISDGFSYIIFNSNDTSNIYNAASGKIRFESNNFYYTNQNFHYENGALIIQQADQSVMRTEPDFNIYYDEISNKTTIVTTMIQLSGTSYNIGGTDYHTIDSKLIQSISESHRLIWTTAKGFPNGQNITVNITTKFGTLWHKFFESELDNLPNNIRNTTTNLNFTSYKDTKTRETMYYVNLQLDNIYILDLKKGIVEINLN